MHGKVGMCRSKDPKGWSFELCLQNLGIERSKARCLLLVCLRRLRYEHRGGLIFGWRKIMGNAWRKVWLS